MIKKIEILGMSLKWSFQIVKICILYENVTINKKIK